VTTAAVTILCATFNARDSVRLTLRSLLLHTHEPHRVLVADNGSTDGTLDDLLVTPWLTVVRLASDHGGALDILATRVETPFFLTLDSDVEFLESGWLSGFLDLAIRDRLDALGVYEPAIGSYQARLAPYACLLRTETFRALNASFREFATFTDPGESARFRSRNHQESLTSSEVSSYRSGRFYPTAAAVFEQLQRTGARWADLPPRLSRTFRHLGHMSWNAADELRTYTRRRLVELNPEPGWPPALAESV
jgi:hypothetical protein